MSAVEEARLRLAELRREAADLLSVIDTSEYPAPTGENIHQQMPGPYWEVDNFGPARHGPRWRINACPGHSDVLFFGEQDHESWAWDAARWTPQNADVQTVRLDTARRYAMAILAACRWLDEQRRPELRVAGAEGSE